LSRCGYLQESFNGCTAMLRCKSPYGLVVLHLLSFTYRLRTRYRSSTVSMDLLIRLMSPRRATGRSRGSSRTLASSRLLYNRPIIGSIILCTSASSQRPFEPLYLTSTLPGKSAACEHVPRVFLLLIVHSSVSYTRA
jgi:hypothetical protein